MNIVPNWYGKLTLFRVLLMSIPCIIIGCVLIVTGVVDARFLASPPINLSEKTVVLENDMYVELSEYSVAAVLDILDSDTGTADGKINFNSVSSTDVTDNKFIKKIQAVYQQMFAKKEL